MARKSDKAEREWLQSLIDKLNAPEQGLYELFEPGHERKSLGPLFRHLATEGRLPNGSREHLLEVFEQHVSCTRTPEINRDGRVKWTTKRTFRSDYGRAVFALLDLAARTGTPLRVGYCKYERCTQLFLVEVKGRGRVRRDFCCAAHGNAYAQKQFRQRQRSDRMAGSSRR